MVISARENLITFAYLADHPSPTEYVSIGVKGAYLHECDCGRAMTLVKKIFTRNGIDLIKDVLSYASGSQL